MAFIFAFPRFDLFACQERKTHTRKARFSCDAFHLDFP
jgi:hypothetical protein